MRMIGCELLRVSDVNGKEVGIYKIDAPNVDIYYVFAEFYGGYVDECFINDESEALNCYRAYYKKMLENS